MTEQELPSREDPLAAKIYGEFMLAKRHRRPMDRKWYLAQMWYLGEYDKLSSASEDQQIPRRRRAKKTRRFSRPTKHIKRATNLLSSKLMRLEPEFDVGAGGLDQRDKLAARAARDLLRHHYRENRLAAERIKVTKPLIITGNGFLKTFWDPNFGPSQPVMETCPACSGTGVVIEEGDEDEVVDAMGIECPECEGLGLVKDGEEVLGDGRVTAVPPQEIYPHPESEDIDTGAFFFHAYPVSREQAKENYNLTDEEVRQSAMFEEGESDYTKWLKTVRATEDDEKVIWVIEKYLPPLPGEKEWRWAVVVGTKTVWPKRGGGKDDDQGDGSYEDGWVRMNTGGAKPIHHFRLDIVPENFWGEGRVLDAAPAQTLVNNARDNLAEHLENMAKVKWAVEEGSIDDDALTKRVGEIVRYRGVNPPKQMQPSAMPQYVVDMIGRETEEVYETMHVSPLDKGSVPPNVESSTALNLIIEQAETPLLEFIPVHREVWKDVGRSLLRICMARYGGEERTMRVSGPGGRMEAKRLVAADLSDSVDIDVRIASTAHRSPTIMRQAVLDAHKAGLIDDAEARRQYEFGRRDSDIDPIDRLQEQAAESENEIVEQGQVHQIDETDDHQIHYDAHLRAALVARLDEATQHLVQPLLEAAKAHKKILETAEMAAQQAQQGQPPQ